MFPNSFNIPLLSRLTPRASINPGLDFAHIARDADTVREYTSDSLFQTKTTPRPSLCGYRAMAGAA